MADFKSKRIDFRPEKVDFRPELADFRLERADFRPNSRISVRWSAVPVAPKSVHVRCEGERGSGPEGAKDLCLARI